MTKLLLILAAIIAAPIALMAAAFMASVIGYIVIHGYEGIRNIFRKGEDRK